MRIRRRLSLLSLLLLVPLGCSGPFPIQLPDQLYVLPPPSYDLQTRTGVKLILRGATIDPEAVDRHLRQVEAALGYTGTDLSQLYIVIEPWAMTPDGTFAIHPCFPSAPRMMCGGYFAPLRGFYIIGIHLAYAMANNLDHTALRFEANRFFKFIHHSPDWNCREYATLGCFSRYTDLPLGWVPSNVSLK